MPTTAMNTRSSATFRPEEISRKTSGMKLLPMARSRPAQRLYANMTSTPTSMMMI